jgi:polar amino acid transport system substrate-binding protein
MWQSRVAGVQSQMWLWLALALSMSCAVGAQEAAMPEVHVGMGLPKPPYVME